MSLSARLAGPACPDLFVQWFDSQPGSRQAGLGMVVGVWAQPTCWGTGFFRPPSWLLQTSLCGRSPGRAAAQGLRECSTSRPLGPLTSRAQKPSRRRMNPGCCLSSHLPGHVVSQPADPPRDDNQATWNAILHSQSLFAPVYTGKVSCGPVQPSSAC